MAYHKILIAVDSSECSFAAARKGFDLALDLDAQPALIFVIDEARTIHSSDTGILPEDAIAVLKAEAEETLDQLSGMYHGEELVMFMPKGRPHHDIIKTCETWGADLIVMGTHGRTGLSHLLLGSVAEHVLRHSKVPVLIIPAK